MQRRDPNLATKNFGKDEMSRSRRMVEYFMSLLSQSPGHRLNEI